LNLKYASIENKGLAWNTCKKYCLRRFFHTLS